MRIVYTSIVIVILNSCSSPQQLQSPMYGAASTYKTIPAVSDSLSSAIYSNAVLFKGFQNADGQDHVFGLNLGVHRAHTFKYLQFFYGVNTGAGIYTLGDSAGTRKAGSVFWFGSVGLSGGFNLVIPRADGDEWRIICFEYNWQHDRGSYAAFRQKLSYGPNVALIERSRNHHNFNIGTEIYVKMKPGAFGLKGGVVVGNTLKPEKYMMSGNEVRLNEVTPYYYFGTLQMTRGKRTIFFQANLGYNTISGHIGLTYRLK